MEGRKKWRERGKTEWWEGWNGWRKGGKERREERERSGGEEGKSCGKRKGRDDVVTREGMKDKE